MTEIFETTDPEMAHHTLAAVYGRMRLSVAGSDHMMRLTRTVLGPLEFHTDVFRMDFHADVSPLGKLVFTRVLGGKVTYESRRHRVDGGVGDIYLAVQPEDRYRASVNNLDVELGIIDAALLEQVAAAAPSRHPMPVRILDYWPVTPAAAALWAETYAYLRDSVLGNPDAVGHPLVIRNAANLFATAVLAAFPNSALLDPTIEDRRDAHPLSLKRAMSYIEENAERDITMAGIAEAVHVTIRALQLAFRRHLNTTPTAYLRRVRLDRAHRDLLAADPLTTNVGTLAARWGFASHSRFTAYYRAVYGETPSATLRRG